MGAYGYLCMEYKQLRKWDAHPGMYGIFTGSFGVDKCSIPGAYG
jgi:hypothetical protein